MKKYIAHLLLIITLLSLFISTCAQKNQIKTTEHKMTKTINLNAPVKSKQTVLDSRKLYARTCALIDAKTGRLLYGKDENVPRAMASTTKIMTCILALEKGDLSSIVTVSGRAQSAPKVHLTMRSGESYLLKDLLYSLMLESHNDSAVAIAEHIGGSVEGFAKLMNEKAKQLGLTQTHFVTPNGLDADSHQTTAYELCQIGRYAIKNPTFLSIISTKSYSFSDQNNRRKFMVNNKDSFLSMFAGAFGIKTGYTGDAGFCFVGAATQNGLTLISSVLGSGWPPHKSYKWTDTVSLMSYGFSQFFDYDINLAKLSTSTIVVEDGSESSVTCLCPETATFLVSNNEPYQIMCTYPDKLTAPVAKGSPVGSVQIKLGNSIVYTNKLYTTASVDVQGFGYVIIDMFNKFINF